MNKKRIYSDDSDEDMQYNIDTLVSSKKNRCAIYSSDEDDELAFTNCEERTNSSDSLSSADENDALSEDNYSFMDYNDHRNMCEADTNWSSVDIEPVLHDFTGQEGIKVNLSMDSLTSDVFSLFFDDLLIKKLVCWTNARAELLRNSTNLLPNSSMKTWTAVTENEMKQFLGLCIVMGNIRMPTLKAYWSTNAQYYHPLFRKIMCRNRFQSILRCLCFCKETDDKTDRLYKIDQVLRHILKNIQNTYYPGENLSIDEALLLWRDRLMFRQYNPHKKTKYDIKIYELCTPDGFVLNTLIYSKDTVINEDDHASWVVYELMKDYLGKGHTIFMNNYYNSVQLATSLYKDKTHIAGMLRKYRKNNPKTVTHAKLKRGQSIFARNGNILVQKWRDKRDVLTISTKHKALLQEVKCKTGTKKSKPSTVIDYNKNMSGINRCDQMISYYSTPKSIRWYIKVFFHLFDVMIWNACWLYNKVKYTRMSYLEYRNDIVAKLLNFDSKVSFSPSIQNKCNVQHYPKKLEKRLRCRVCSIENRRTATWYSCEICKSDNGNPIGLCVDECFKKYHKK